MNTIIHVVIFFKYPDNADKFERLCSLERDIVTEIFFIYQP